jgi:hypothetical protein
MFQGSGFAVVAVSIVGVFSAVAGGLYMKLRQTRRELQKIGATEEPVRESQGSGSVLAPHVEQHLIDMIRKSNTSSSTTGSMPVLKREEPTGQAR